MNVNNLLDFDDYRPELPHNFWCSISMGIGPSEEEGHHDFVLYVGTATALDHLIQNQGPLGGRHHLFVRSFDGPRIKNWIEKTIFDSTRETFWETALVLARYFQWEFEDFVPFVDEG